MKDFRANTGAGASAAMVFKVRMFVAVLAFFLVLPLFFTRSEIEIFTKTDDCLDSGGCWRHKSMKCEFDSQARCEEERPRK